MDDIKQFITNKIAEKKQQDKSEYSLLVLFLMSSGMSFIMLIFYSYFRYSHQGFNLNHLFNYSTIMLLFSCGFIYLSQKQYLHDNLTYGLYFLLFSCANTLFFCLLQYKGWNLLKNTYKNTPFYTTEFLSFIIVSSYHYFHVVAGIFFQCFLFYKHYKLKIHSKEIILINFACYYWYFITSIGLIIYLIYK